MFDIFMHQRLPINESDKLRNFINGKESGDPVEMLNSLFGNGWTYKIENLIFPSTVGPDCYLVVTLGIPGFVRSGIGLNNVSNAINNILKTMYFDVEKTILLEESKVEIKKLFEDIKPQEQMELPKIEEVVATCKEQCKDACESYVTDINVGNNIQSSTIIAKEINPKILKVMNSLGISESEATEYGRACKNYNINSKEKLLKYLQAWNIDIKDTKDLKGKDVYGFTEWLNMQDAFTMDDQEV